MTKVCKTCGEDFIPQFNLKNFCSMKCRYGGTTDNAGMNTERDISRIEYLKSIPDDDKNDYYNRDVFKEKVFSKFHSNGKICSLKKTIKDKTDAISWNDAGADLKRKRIIEEQNNKCDECGISEWFGVSISIEIDHVDGNRNNDERTNLRGLCPNCHSLTKTWRGKNYFAKKISDEQLKDAIKSHASIAQALSSLGMAPKGGNYKRANRIKALIKAEKCLD